MNDIDDLIARLEAAMEGSRELDKTISKLIGTYSAPDRGDPTGTWKSYTTSLDAALTLVPEGWQFGIGTHPADELFNPGGAQAYCTKHGTGGAPRGYAHADAHTAPLALCIVALKARAGGL